MDRRRSEALRVRACSLQVHIRDAMSGMVIAPMLRQPGARHPLLRRCHSQTLDRAVSEGKWAGGRRVNGIPHQRLVEFRGDLGALNNDGGTANQRAEETGRVARRCLMRTGLDHPPYRNWRIHRAFSGGASRLWCSRRWRLEPSDDALTKKDGIGPAVGLDHL